MQLHCAFQSTNSRVHSRADLVGFVVDFPVYERFDASVLREIAILACSFP
jgi:hypothetical protein